jgi:large subunit ribosomal protein L7/L12
MSQRIGKSFLEMRRTLLQHHKLKLGGSRPFASFSSHYALNNSSRSNYDVPILRVQLQSRLFSSDSKDDAGTKEYSTPELTRDAAAHKEGLLETDAAGDDSDRPSYQNPLHHNNPDMQKIFREDFDTDEEFQAAVQPAPTFVEGSNTGNEVAAASTLAPEYLHEIADEIVHLTMLEMNELINKIADHYDFDEGMLSPNDDGSGGGGGDDDDDGPEAAAVEEKTIFDIKLTAFDAKSKIKVIKEVRAIAGLGLKEAKEMVEGAPKTILKDIKKEQAEEIKIKLEELGATIEIV